MEFEDSWLEVRACAGGGQTAEADSSMLKVPAISEALEAAASVSRHPGMWDYSRRLVSAEVKAIQSVLELVKTSEDGRSVSHSINVAYKGLCYTLTLFEIKRSQ
ncbi:MAG: hypothetical protein AB1351_10410 [Thermoproteota archaeon]